MAYKISDMTPEGRELLEKMRVEVSNFEVLMTAIAPAVALKKLFGHPVSQLLDLVLPFPSEWDVLTEFLKTSSRLKNVLKNKLKLLWVKYRTNHHWNAADKAFIETFYNSIKRS